MKIEEANHILKTVYENRNAMTSEVLYKFNQAKAVFTEHYENNPKDFIEHYIRILHGKTNLEVPFILNEAQISLVKAMETSRFVAAPKARQLGLTTLTNALALHHSLFALNANAICMAFKTDNAQENLRRIKTMFSLMPDWVKWLVQDFDEKKGHQNNTGLWSFRSKLTGTNNKLEVSSASSADATRGKTPTFLHWTEVAFSDIAEEIFTSVFPALNRRKDSVIVLESTGNGNSGFYYEVCVGIRKGFEVVFMPWYLDNDYREEGEELTIEDKYYIAELMGVSKLPEGLDDDQLRWYRTTSHAIGKAKGQQEYPINVEQVFQATNSSFFSPKCTDKLQGGESITSWTFENGLLTTRPVGPGTLYENVRTDYEYIIACDPSEGTIDPSVITVLNPLGHEVLHWREKMLPEDLVRLLDVLGKHFNNAQILIESNGIGQYVIRTLRSTYLYNNLAYYDGKPGMRMSVATKPIILSILQESIMNDKVVFYNTVLANEMATFEADTMKAVKSKHDDCIMSAALAAWLFDTNPPKFRRIQDNYHDYTDEVYGKQNKRRRFMI